MRHLLRLFCVFASASAVCAQELAATWGTGRREAKYYRIVDVPMPPDLALEVGSFCTLPEGRLAVGTRRGEILLLTGAFDELPKPRIQRFASGLDEVFGLGYRQGAFYAMQQTELSRITDQDGDGSADHFDNLSDVWGFEHYHEFGWGSPVMPDGSVYVVLGLSDSYSYKARYRGWAFQITAEGKSIPVACGIRSAGGVGPNEQGVMFYVESQGPWNGSCSLKQLRTGGFMGHPISFPGYDEPLGATMGKKPIEPNDDSRLVTECARVQELVPYAVVFPYRKMGQSITTFRIDRTNGKFGPFAGQLFLGDYSLSVVMRATTELVDGVWQGACYPFREGFGNGILAVEFSDNGYLVTGGTNRGWPVRGNRQFVLERIEWTGVTPFEIERITIAKDGFHVRFTKPVDRATAALAANYQLQSYTHIYHEGYGSPEVDQTTPRTTLATPSEDGRTVHLTIDGMVLGHVHEFDLSGVRSADGDEILHKNAFYTVNRIPK
ncbi:hypothetical protein LBMAG49_16100 [Planctomycetota bacterium]|nr:hypothetical protein [Planctomycetota bacterium]MSR39365.1 hypothetical protein [Planctomycetota bacterium]GDY02281.1 hypothetical protein LBMAG49_16100 [Planctomycetota bacterium]